MKLKLKSLIIFFILILIFILIKYRFTIYHFILLQLFSLLAPYNKKLSDHFYFTKFDLENKIINDKKFENNLVENNQSKNIKTYIWSDIKDIFNKDFFTPFNI
jgi:hypothetical protein